MVTFDELSLTKGLTQVIRRLSGHEPIQIDPDTPTYLGDGKQQQACKQTGRMTEQL